MRAPKTHTIRIIGWSNEGRGVGRLDGLAVFVDGALPGDLAEIEILRAKKRYAEARALRILEPSPNRVMPPCPHSSVCDGCALIALAPEAQRALKTEQVHEVVARIGGFDLPCAFHPSPSLEYRNKINARLTRDARLAYSKRGTNDLFPISDCPVAMPRIRQTIRLWNDELAPRLSSQDLNAAIRMVVLRTNSAAELLIALATDPMPDDRLAAVFTLIQAHLAPDVLCARANARPGDVSLYEPMTYATSRHVLRETLSNLDFEISPSSFFQVNRFSTALLYDEALSEFTNLDQARILDLYCGTGTTSLLLAQRAKEVLGIESHPAAVEDAKRNAKRNGIANARFLCAKAEDVVGKITRESHFDAVLVDPPRKGLDEAVVKAICETDLKEVVYISCNPATMARDAARFKEGGFEMKVLKAVDQFPNTASVEGIGVLRR